MLRILLTVFAFLAWVPTAWGQGVMLTIANGDHQTLRDTSDAASVLWVGRRFAAVGFDVDQATDLSAPAMRTALDALAERVARELPERVVLVFAGYTLHSDRGAWLMGVETGTPTPTNVDTTGVRLETLLDVVSRIQGGAVVAIADLGFPGALGFGFQQGLGTGIVVPQGVSLIRGPAVQVQHVLGELAVPGTVLRHAVGATRQVRLEGFNPPHLSFLPAGLEPAPDLDRAAWIHAEAEGTIVALNTYLTDFPNGRYVENARAALDRLENTPERVEERLNLSRDERRAIQRHLTLLGFDPRGIDGIFGPGTRGAINGWQGREGLARTGFLDRDQIHRLAAQAARRAAELEEEARQRQAEQERQDRAFWRDTGAGQDEAGLRAYLGRFPDGIFSNIARERLDQIEAERRAAAQARDREAWEQATARDTPEAYRRYLAEFPEGVFAEQARARIEELTRPPAPELNIDAARAAEAALNLPRPILLVVEQRLAATGFDPGAVDGQLDEDARRAIRRFQRANGLAPTGYLTQGAVAMLLTDGLFRLRD